ncbi:MAG: hypothetical protein AB1424_01000 [Thermodesulfobacteriota bacterium]
MIECRGRNGWFQLHEATAFVSSDAHASISLQSKKPYVDMPPIYFAGPKAEVEALLQDLLDKVRAIGGSSLYCDDCAYEKDWPHPLNHRVWGTCPICKEGDRFLNQNLGDPEKVRAIP